MVWIRSAPQRWRRQPPYPVEIDWNNELTRDLVGLWVPNTGLLLRDLVSGVVATPVGSGHQLLRRLEATGYGFATVGSPTGHLDHWDSNRLLSTVLGSTSASRTTVALMAQHGSEGSAPIHLGVPSTGQDWVLRGNGAGQWRLNIWGVVSVDAAYGAENQHVLAGATYDNSSTTNRVWLDGVQRSSANGSVNTTDSNIKLGAWVFSGGYRVLKPVFLAGIFKVAKPAGWWAEMLANPWQILRPKLGRIVIDLAAAGGGNSDFSSSGLGSVSLFASALSSSSISFAGTGASSFLGNSIAESTWSLSGTATSSLVGSGETGSSFLSSGSSAVSLASSSVAAASISSVGGSSVAGSGASTASGLFSTAGVSSVSWVSQVGGSFWNSLGIATVSYTGSSINNTLFSSIGAADVQLFSSGIPPVITGVSEAIPNRAFFLM